MTRRQYATGLLALAVTFVIFVVPFIFVFLTAVKSKSEAARMALSCSARAKPLGTVDMGAPVRWRAASK